MPIEEALDFWEEMVNQPFNADFADFANSMREIHVNPIFDKENYLFSFLENDNETPQPTLIRDRTTFENYISKKYELKRNLKKSSNSTIEVLKEIKLRNQKEFELKITQITERVQIIYNSKSLLLFKLGILEKFLDSFIVGLNNRLQKYEGYEPIKINKLPIWKQFKKNNNPSLLLEDLVNSIFSYLNPKKYSFSKSTYQDYRSLLEQIKLLILENKTKSELAFSTEGVKKNEVIYCFKVLKDLWFGTNSRPQIKFNEFIANSFDIFDKQDSGYIAKKFSDNIKGIKQHSFLPRVVRQFESIKTPKES